ncbi:DUF721 domain-containing protein [Gilliamella apis]|uniref:DUF721 domain-containing protein n=1 Tax=Gilliamella apis TaxID=1970738 RepID=A0A242NVD7_9GAMM|nr:DciA family protein [Gilliamella apis]OTQ36815.1 hypothetical protein B6C84_01725 [Gilliamella apis]OTQ38767.1 hypothetical protein B6C88_01225 [Gilliamella apis]OTQ39671.1 hypothetical protein B6D26_07940 [Gilliamella apis]OTQ43581.1 hypothetical protein B6C94_02575 [Gilliamella apis]OTQ47373.1 hypothetical protein B6C86_01745 [Gilliamella apis]
MRDNEPKVLTSLLSQGALLSKIKDRTIALSQLTKIIDELLPPPLIQQYRVANYRQGVLILEVSSASWLTRLKYEQGNLLSGIRQKILPSLSSIQYKINPTIATNYSQSVILSDKNVKISNVISKQTAIYLNAIAEQAPDKLKKQLIKLANHAK